MSDVLVAKVLDKIAEEIYGFPSWKEFADEQDTDMPNELYSVIETALRLSQAEVEKAIDKKIKHFEVISKEHEYYSTKLNETEICNCNACETRASIILELQDLKRLLAKSEGVK